MKDQMKVLNKDMDQSSEVSKDANLVYLLDQFYSNSWNKLLIVFSAVGVLVGVVVPLVIEYMRKNSNKKKIEQFQKSLNDAVELVNSLKTEMDVLSSENEKVVNRVKEEGLKRQKETIELIRTLLASSFDEDAIQNVEKELILIEKDIDRSADINKENPPFLSISIDGNVIAGSTVREFYKNIFEYLINNVEDMDKYNKYKTGNVRYLINDENKHLNGGKFTLPLKVGKYYIETHKSKSGALKDVIKFLKTIEEVEVKE
ncbi:hypothetical protein C1T20_19255 [Paenibacillus polymyxa]|nr:hypothetical protein C1T20_19255 [Paenibacillus polymyxa]